ncbi:peptidase S9 [Alphaproteobacteria bacterium]|nr:peptidase S9 [Alphaproteobacteria bacterium]
MFKKIICVSLLSFAVVCNVHGASKSKSDSAAKKTTKPANNKKNTLIPRKVLLAKPDRFCVSMSHDGKKIAYVARKDDQVEVRVEDLSGKLLNKFSIKPTRGLHEIGLVWMFTGNHILVPQDENGDENYHIYCLDVVTGRMKNLTPFKGAKSSPEKISKKYPNEVIIACNKDDPKWFDAYRLNVITGKIDLIFKNREYSSFIFDSNLNLRIASKSMPDASDERHALHNGKFELIKKIPYEDAKSTYPLFFSSDCQILYGLDSTGRDKSALVAYDLENKTSKVLYTSDLADISSVDTDPNTRAPQAVVVNYLKPEIFTLDPNVANDMEYLKSKSDGMTINILEKNDQNNIWLVVFSSPTMSKQYYLYRRDEKNNRPLSLKYLFAAQPELDKYQLQEMTPVVIKSRDGLDLVCYLTKAFDFKEGNPSKMVVYVHGGPWARDGFGFVTTAQLLANRGYSVLQINYRGSTGFGKAFANAIDHNLDKVRNDIIDGVNWAIENKIADRKQIAIMGGSFGGYSTLAGLAYTPDVFCCGVDVVGPSNWITTFKKVPPYWIPTMVHWYRCAGDPRTEEGREELLANSPITRVKNIKKPLIIFQGAQDPRVNKAESDQMVADMIKNGLTVVYVLYPDEGHGFQREPNSRSYLALTEKFLSRVLGGWYESIHEKELEGSSHQIIEGKSLQD